MVAIAWIRRSMRQYDNTALVEASKEHDKVYPFYVVDDEYFEQTQLGYPRVKFWHDSLKELRDILRDSKKDLFVRKGKPVEQLQKFADQVQADAIYHNRDYTPYGQRRDEEVKEELDIPVKTFKDLVMFEKDEILTNSGDPYSVYTYYSKKWFDRNKRRPEEPVEYHITDINPGDIPSLEELGFEKPEEMEDIWEGGRENGLQRLEDFKDKIGEYDDSRDTPSVDGTSKLSPHIKFGTVSVRELFWEAERMKARTDDEGVKTWQEELAWRDFYYQVLYHNPQTTTSPFLEKYSSLDWRTKDEAGEDWERFINGKTGYPFVDAGMRQLKKTGWMHNRLRMVVTSFACKDLWLDWRDLHDYYKEMFIDADLASMIGGIQWAYSIGTDAQPYFRVFNPVSQGETHDPDGEYVRKWVPELEDVPDSYIHNPWKMPDYVQEDKDVKIGEDYPEPIVDHSERREKAISRFEEAADNS